MMPREAQQLQDAGIPTGRLVSDFRSFMGGTPPITGRVIITAEVPRMFFPTLKKGVIARPIECPVFNGKIYPPGTVDPEGVEPGVTVVASDQPTGNPSHVTYRATIRLEGSPTVRTSRPIEIPTDGTTSIGYYLGTEPVGATE